jgi:hypothetical protein
MSRNALSASDDAVSNEMICPAKTNVDAIMNFVSLKYTAEETVARYRVFG